MEGVEARPGLREVRDPLLGVRHHQVAVQEGVRKVLPQGLDDGRTESQVRDEVAVLPGRSGTRACKEKGGEGEGSADWDVAWHSVRAGLSPDGVGQPASLAEGVARAPSGWRWSDLGRTPSPISQSAKRPAARGRRSPATSESFSGWKVGLNPVTHHNVDMQPVGSTRKHALGLLCEPGKVTAQDRGRDLACWPVCHRGAHLLRSESQSRCPRPPARHDQSSGAGAFGAVLPHFWFSLSDGTSRSEPEDGVKAGESRPSEEAGRDVSPRRSVAQGRGGGGLEVGRRAEVAFAPTPRHPPAGPVLVRKLREEPAPVLAVQQRV